MEKILLVDDDPDFVEATKLILESKPYEVVVACDGKEGLKKIKGLKPDAVILDVMMPEVDGYNVCSILKGDPELRDIPILLLTSVVSHIPSSKFTKEMGMKAEADDFIDKPVEPSELLASIDNLLKK